MFADRVMLGPGRFMSLRQQQVWKLIADNETTLGCALALHVSSKTVEWHRKMLLRSLRIEGIAALTKLAIKIGLTTV